MKKYTSRKFLSALAGMIAGVVMVFGIDEEIVSTISGAVISLASLVAYIVTEGKVDAAGAAAPEEDKK